MASLGATELVVILVVLAVLAAVVVALVLGVAAAARRTGRGGLQARLSELDALRASGRISEQEHAAARARALGL